MIVNFDKLYLNFYLIVINIYFFIGNYFYMILMSFNPLTPKRREFEVTFHRIFFSFFSKFSFVDLRFPVEFSSELPARNRNKPISWRSGDVTACYAAANLIHRQRARYQTVIYPGGDKEKYMQREGPIDTIVREPVCPG